MEFHKKLAIPVACMVFVVLGLPMAVTASRSGKGISLGLALGLYLIYYLFLVGGEKAADRGRSTPRSPCGPPTWCSWRWESRSSS